MQYFILEKSPIFNDRCRIRLNSQHNIFQINLNEVDILISRLLNLTFPSYLYYARSVLGADLIGKNNKYIVPYFCFTQELDSFLNMLNSYAEYLDFEMNHQYDIKEKDGKLVSVEFK